LQSQKPNKETEMKDKVLCLVPQATLVTLPRSVAARDMVLPAGSLLTRAFLLSIVFAIAAAAHGQHSPSGSSATTFDKYWVVAASPFDQANQFAYSLAEFANGNLVAVGGDLGIQATACKGLVGGAWMISTNLNGGNVFQKLSATCVSNSGQNWGTIRPTADGGGILVGEDDANSLCNPCAIVAKSDSLGNVTFAQDLTTFAASALRGITPTSDGGSITAGLGQAVLTQPNSGLVMKLSSTGSPQWTQLFTETAQSFPGAVVNSGGGLVLETINPTPDGGYVVSGVADAQFTNGFANVLTVIKLNSAQGLDWAKVYYSSHWGSFGAGISRYSVIPTNNGYVVSGTLQGIASQFAFPHLFFLMSLDLQGNIVWQKGYGDSINNADGTVAIATSDGGYLLGGETNQFGGGGEYVGWLIKTDVSGNITWQNRYVAGEPAGSNSDVIKDIIQTRDGGFAVAGYAYTGSLSYGGPSFWFFKTDSQGIVSGTCCQQATTSTVQPIDLQAFNAVYTQASVTPVFTPITLATKRTSVTPNSLF
jgi:hypothetical protein